MSDPALKAELSKFKDARQQPAPDNPSNGNKKKKLKKPWELQWRIKKKHRKTRNIMTQLIDSRDWEKQKGYAKREDALQNLSKCQRGGLGYWFDYRVVNIEEGRHYDKPGVARRVGSRG